MRLGIDVMGGDHAPSEILSGALSSSVYLEDTDRVVLYGDSSLIQSAITDSNVNKNLFEVVHCSEVITMDDSPVEAVRKKQDSSIVRLAYDASPKQNSPLDGIISAGNTGAFAAAAQMHLRRISGIQRPGIAATFPTPSGPVVVLDVGANIEPKPQHLYEYALMGTLYAKKIFNVENPKVGLMNVGSEEGKGTEYTKQTRELCEQSSSLEFIGYIEGREIFSGKANVVICDGLVGNVSLKVAEGLSKIIFEQLTDSIKSLGDNVASDVGKALRDFKNKYDYHSYGGAPLLGVNGNCLIAHGSSQSKTIQNAILTLRKSVESGLLEQMKVSFNQVGI